MPANPHAAGTGAALARWLAVLMVPWAFAVVLAPVAASAGGWTAASAVPVYAAGALVCHQRPDCSFVTAGRKWPVCARCAGIYLGAGLTAGFGLAAPRRRRWGAAAPGAWRARLAAGAAPAAVTWAIERAGIAPVSNGLRAASGLVLGILVAAAVVSILPDRRAVPKT